MRRPIRFVAALPDCCDSADRFYGWDATSPSSARRVGSAAAPAFHLPPGLVCRSVHAADLGQRPGAARRRHPQVEVTFEETRAHLGVETQRQGSDKAILRATPALLALFSIITLWTHDLAASRQLTPRAAAWHPKTSLTFSDAIAAVRRENWRHQISFMSRPSRNSIEIPRHIWQRMENALAFAA